MAVAIDPPKLASHLVNGILSIKPLADFAKHQARTMMIKRAESIGVNWRQDVEALRSRGSVASFSPVWEAELAQIENPNLSYPDYYLRPFHAYEQGNLSWEAAMEVEVAAYAVHARIWQDAGAKGDAMLRQSYHTVLQQHLPVPPQAILDIGCSVGMSTLALQATYPESSVTGLDLSPYFLTIAQYRASVLSPSPPLTWLHAPAEATGLADASFDLISAHLLFHELPQSAAAEILREARRLLRSGGHLAIMDMNPQSEVFLKLPPYVLTLLKSTEPYLDDYLSLDLAQALYAVGFARPIVICNSPRHRTVIAQAR
jgi:ubiquinone/menaquinone biosynthesis C-methylase UbiE